MTYKGNLNNVGLLICPFRCGMITKHVDKDKEEICPNTSGMALISNRISQYVCN